MSLLEAVDSEIPEYLQLLSELSTKVWRSNIQFFYKINYNAGWVHDTTRDQISWQNQQRWILH